MDTQGILALESRRYDAMTGNDQATLATLLHDDLIYTHSTGLIDTKASYMESISSGRVQYKRVEIADQQVKLLGDVALIIGGSRIDVVVKGTPKSLTLRSLAAWTSTANGWQFIAWQSCAVTT